MVGLPDSRPCLHIQVHTPLYVEMDIHNLKKILNTLYYNCNGEIQEYRPGPPGMCVYVCVCVYMCVICEF